jgi:NNMT/PNMT/TEMT family protein
MIASCAHRRPTQRRRNLVADPHSRAAILPLSRTAVNAEIEWDRFDPDQYWSYNYGTLRTDDAEIIDIVKDFFAGTRTRAGSARAIDVGTGANLYPALTMLPYSSKVTLFDHAHSNLSWLSRELADPRDSWLDFWHRIADGHPRHQAIDRPLERLRRRARVEPGNVFSLTPDHYEIGTMFFVAESITTQQEEFCRALHLFVNSLVPGAPFAAAFMRGSSGYVVGQQPFPACWVDEQDVREALTPVARSVQVTRVNSTGLREGYHGMMVATGFKR